MSPEPWKGDRWRWAIDHPVRSQVLSPRRGSVGSVTPAPGAGAPGYRPSPLSGPAPVRPNLRLKKRMVGTARQKTASILIFQQVGRVLDPTLSRPMECRVELPTYETGR